MASGRFRTSRLPDHLRWPHRVDLHIVPKLAPQMYDMLRSNPCGSPVACTWRNVAPWLRVDQVWPGIWTDIDQTWTAVIQGWSGFHTPDLGADVVEFGPTWASKVCQVRPNSDRLRPHLVKHLSNSPGSLSPRRATLRWRRVRRRKFALRWPRPKPSWPLGLGQAGPGVAGAWARDPTPCAVGGLPSLRAWLAQRGE